MYCVVAMGYLGMGMCVVLFVIVVGGGGLCGCVLDEMIPIHIEQDII